jgi:hypothetical protein
MIKELWLDNGKIPKNNINFINAELGLFEAMDEYLGIVKKIDKFDVVLLSMGGDGTDSTFMQDKVLRLNLEDLFLNYNETIGRIKEFLDIDFAHVDKGNKFKHKSTNDCVGIWRGVLDQGTTLQIEKELGEYCYNAL